MLRPLHGSCQFVTTGVSSVIWLVVSDVVCTAKEFQYLLGFNFVLKRAGEIVWRRISAMHNNVEIWLSVSAIG